MNFGEVLFVPLLALQITLTLREAICLSCQVVECVSGANFRESVCTFGTGLTSVACKRLTSRTPQLQSKRMKQ